MKQLKVWLGIVASLALCANIAWALTAVPWAIPDLVRKADLVLVAKTVKTTKGNATVQVVEVLNKTIRVTNIRKWRSDPLVLPEGKEYLLFLAKATDGYEIVGSNGHLEGLKDPELRKEAIKAIKSENEIDEQENAASN